MSLVWITRERLHELIEVFWSPDAWREKTRRHRYIDGLFDALEQQRATEIAADVLQRYPDTWEDSPP